MILDALTVADLFLAGLGLVLALAVAALGARGWSANRRASDPVGRDAAEERGHLVFLVVAALAGLHALAWPLFHALLVSYVDDLRPLGAMCAYGVTRLAPRLVDAVQLLEPLVLWCAGLWLLLALADRRTLTAPFLGPRLRAAVLLGLLAAAAAGARIAYATSPKLGEPVTCCSQLLTASAALAPSGGAGSGASLLGGFATPAAFVLVNVAVLALALLLRRGWPAGARGYAAGAGLALLALLDIAVTRDAWADELAPRVLGLPHHRCLYEVLSATPGLAVAALLAIAGNAALVYPLALQPARARANDVVARLQASVLGFAALALASELVLVAAHW